MLASLAGSLLSVVEVLIREADTLTKRVLDEVRVEPTAYDGAGRRLASRIGILRHDRPAKPVS